MDAAYAGDLTVTSGYRCPARNAAIDIASTISRHMKGKALDYNQGTSAANCAVWLAARSLKSVPTENLLYYLNDKGSKVHTDAPQCGPDNTTNYIQGHAGW